MGESGRLVEKVEIKSSADLIYELFSSKQYQIPKICPHKLREVELHEGDWGTVGSTLVSHYIIEGNAGLIAKETIEAIDKENKSVTFNVFGGDLMKLYKVFKMIVQVIEEAETKYVKWIMEYEKVNENVPPPNIFMDFGTEITKELDTYFLKALIP